MTLLLYDWCLANLSRESIKLSQTKLIFSIIYKRIILLAFSLLDAAFEGVSWHLSSQTDHIILASTVYKRISLQVFLLFSRPLLCLIIVKKVVCFMLPFKQLLVMSPSSSRCPRAASTLRQASWSGTLRQLLFQRVPPSGPLHGSTAPHTPRAHLRSHCRCRCVIGKVLKYSSV